MLDEIFINVGHLYKFPPQNINMHVYEHRQAVDMAGGSSIFLSACIAFGLQDASYGLQIWNVNFKIIAARCPVGP